MNIFASAWPIVAAAALAAACGDVPAPPAGGEKIAELAAAPNEDPATIAMQVVADFLSVPETEVTLVSVEAKDFGDPSLGCPSPGMAYAQVITPGHRVIVEADGRRFDVRVSGGHGKICRKPADKQVPNREGATPPEHASPITSEVDRARTDLAARLDANAVDIAVLGVRPFATDGTSPGCRPECRDAAGGCGYLIGLYYDGRQYEYHTFDGRTSPCPPISPI